MQIEGFDQFHFTDDRKTRTVFRRGHGPAVVIMHEIPGITPEVAGFGRRVADSGFTAFLPWMFGTPGKPLSTPYALGQMLRACISSEFYCLSERRSSPITDWLRALARHVHAECGGPGVGAIGMCLTGGFALSMMIDETIMAPVLSQPSCPFPITASRRGAIAISDEELAKVRERVRAGCPVLGLRFTGDPVCPPERFETLRRELGDGFEGIEIDSSPGNKFGIKPKAHSVLTVDFVDREGHPTKDALDRVLQFFKDRLN
ncbi:MAG TPA: dienelactone hydrolase family protein [Blastocatellia bacterium]|nr:dienelactone hydrolase family protein [Blastocatellia bacterium]